MARTKEKAKRPAPAAAVAEADLVWRDIREFRVEGKGWTDTGRFYDRLPARAEGLVTKDVWSLSHHSSGMLARFATDATQIHARWTLRDKDLAMPHMPATGVSGLDLYVRTGGGWRWVGAGRPSLFPTNSSRLVSGLPPVPWFARRLGKPRSDADTWVAAATHGTRQYILYLPLYNGVESVEVGVPKGAEIGPGAVPVPWFARRLGKPRFGATATSAWLAANDASSHGTIASSHGTITSSHGTKPICFYGTSITQGGCASRPGMAYIAILGRWLETPTINLGFSGSGKAEPEMADLLAELDPSVYVIDCLPNVDSAETVRGRVIPMVEKLRAAHRRTPIVLVESVAFQRPPRLTDFHQSWMKKNAALRAGLRRLRAGGMKGLHHVPSAALLGDDGEATVDGIHPTDLGFLRIAQALEPVLRKLL